MIAQSRNYVSEQKKKYLTSMILWSIGVVGIFGAGLIILKQRESYFTVFAGVLVIGIALNFSRFIGFSRFKDGKVEYAKILENMKGGYKLFHSAIIPDNRGTAFFEHVIITSKSVYFLGYDEKMIKTYRLWLENKLVSKGIPMKQIYFMTLTGDVQVKNITLKIEKDACYTDENLEEYTRIINDLLM